VTPAPGSPPSDYAIYALVNDEPGSMRRVVVLTCARALLIAPGLYASGLRGRRLVASALGASTSVTTLLTLWYGANR
jgi:hypothetical protein